MRRAEQRTMSGVDLLVEAAAWRRLRLAGRQVLQVVAAVTVLLMLATASSRIPPSGIYASGAKLLAGMQSASDAHLQSAHVAANEPLPDSRVPRQLEQAGAGIRDESMDVNDSGARSRRKTAYLTFDDGPSGSTERILAVLHRYGVKATFFVVGTTSEQGKALYRRIVREGHQIGNHTFSHDYSSVYRSQEAFRSDVDKLNRLLSETTGQVPDILRYPGGSNNKLGRRFGGPGIMGTIVRDMQDRGYQFFDWNVSSTDAAAPVQERDVIVGSVLGAARGKRDAIVLMHDNTHKTTTVEALPAVIEGLKRQGFSFDVLRRSSFSVHLLEVN